MGRRTKEQALQTKKNILTAALDVLAEKGYSHMTFVDIAERVGLSKGAVYWHFSDKQSLLIELIHEFHDRREHLVAESAPKLTSIDNLCEHFVERTKVVMQDAACRKIAFFLSFQMEWTQQLLEASSDALDELRKDLFQQVLNVLKEAKKQGSIKPQTDEKQTAIILISLWKGLFANDVGGYADMDLVGCVERGFNFIIDAIS
jgi:TetR/AcrR family transcriptional regulator, acrAB operon repressor